MDQSHGPTARNQRIAEIMEAAWDTLVELGYDDFTFGEVAKRSHLARNSLYEYFPSSVELIAETLQNHMKSFQPWFAERLVTATTPEDAVRIFVRSGIEFDRDSNFRAGEGVRRLALAPERIIEMRKFSRHPLEKALADMGSLDNDALSFIHGVMLTAGQNLQVEWNDQYLADACDFAAAGYMALLEQKRAN